MFARREIRVGAFAVVLLVVHTSVMALLVGYVGASRAISVGLQTLWVDHAAGIGIAAAVTAAVAILSATRLRSGSELGMAIAVLALTDLGLAALMTMLVGELDVTGVPQVVAASTGLGTQLAAALLGGVIGLRVRARSHGSAPH